MKKLKHYLLAIGVALFTNATFAQTKPATSEKAATTQAAVQPNMHLLNINTATAAEIQDKLVGIGAKKAQAIVEYREKHGKFLSIEQLTEVSGIGKATLDKNRDRIVLE